jgi:hypothetical protein
MTSHLPLTHRNCPELRKSRKPWTRQSKLKLRLRMRRFANRETRWRKKYV